MCRKSAPPWTLFGVDANIRDPIGPLRLKVVAELVTQTGARRTALERHWWSVRCRRRS